MNDKYKVVIFWGGMCGVVILILVLSVFEYVVFFEEVLIFIMKLVIGFVLFILFVYGISLKFLIKLFGLDWFNVWDEVLRM